MPAKSPINKLILMMFFLMGVSIITAIDLEVYTTEDGLAEGHIRDVAVAPDSSLWIAVGDHAFSTGGLSHFSNNGWHTYYTWNTDSNFLCNIINSVDFDRDGNLWLTCGSVMTASGLIKFDGWNWTSFNEHDILDDEEDYFYSLDFDNEGEIWCTSLDKIINYDGSVFIIDDPSVGFAPVSNYRKILCCSDSIYWLTSSFGVYRVCDSLVQNYRTRDGLITDETSDIDKDLYGNIWVSTYDGINKFDGMSWTNPFETELIIDDYTTLCIDSLNRKWIVFDNELICYCDSAYQIFDLTPYYVQKVLVYNPPATIYLEVSERFTDHSLGILDIESIEWDWIEIDDGIEQIEVKHQKEIDIYPNPFTENCNINTKNASSSIEIFDINGKQILHREGHNVIWKPDENVRNGLYLLRVNNGQSTETKKIVYSK